MVKKLQFIFLFIITVTTLHAQNGNFSWVKQLGGSASDLGYDFVRDSSGNFYLTGIFNGASDFDPGPGVFTLNSFGWSDIFVCKLDSSGNFIWAKQMGGINYDYAKSIRLDNHRNIF